MLKLSGDTSMAGGFFSGTPGSQAATGEKKVI